MHLINFSLGTIAVALTASFQYICAASDYTPPWLTLPPTPTLPKAISSGYVPSTGGAKIWYSIHGTATSSGETAPPILFLHGGFASSDYFGHQIRDLDGLHIPMISIDSRGHGRSTGGIGPITYDKMTNDIIKVLDHLDVPKVAVVGWSDGGILGLDMAMNYSSRVDRVFAFAASYNPDNFPASVAHSKVFNDYLARAEKEYKKLNPDPEWKVFSKKMNTMWADLPQWNGTSFAKIPTLFESKDAPLIWLVDADHDEAITWSTPTQMMKWIPGSGRNILPEVSHFAFIQDPDTFTEMLRIFLARQKW